MRLRYGVLRTLLFFAVVLASSKTIAQVTNSGASPQRATIAARITQAVDETQVVRLKGNVHPMAKPDFDQGAVDDGTPMKRMLLILQRSPEQEASLQELMQGQQSKEAASFHRWLTPQEFGQQFGPADADIEAVTSWLAASGFYGIRTTAGRTAIEFSGNAGQVRKAFRTEIHHFLVNGQERQANVSDPEIPAALAPVVSGIASLNNFASKSMRGVAGTFTRTKEGEIVPHMTGPNGAFYALGPADFWKIYNVPNASFTGTGSKIGVVGVSDINVQDVSDFRNLFGLPASNLTVVYNGPNPGVNDAEGEADLDVEWSGAVAPGAHIDYVVSQGTLTTDAIVLSALYVIDNNLDDVMSVSFGSCEQNLGAGGNGLLSELWEQAAAQGITVVVSTGDSGSAGCDDFHTQTTAEAGVAVSGFASTPFNIAVGGTDFDDSGRQSSFWSSTNATGTHESALGYIPEMTWNDSCAAAATGSNLNNVCVNPDGILVGSGGPSGINAGGFAGYAKPAFQSGVTPADGARDIPDISLFAATGAVSKSFYVVCQADAIPPGNPPSCTPGGSFSFLGVGGTSASAPSFAGVLALIEQSERMRVFGSTGRQGNANFVLYKLAGSTSNFCTSTTQPLTPPASCIFYDVTKGNNSVPCAGGSANCSSTNASNGVLVDPNHPTTPAWTTGTRYDYATGLGTVNVTNLASKWGSAVGAFKGTTASLKLNGGTSTVNLTHGTSVTANVSVAPRSGTGTPTGDVSLLAPATGGTNSGGSGNTLSNGSTSFTTTTLPGGSYNVTAHYAGDETFAPTDSNGVPVVVAPEGSGLQVGIVTFDPVTGSLTSTSATSFAYGSPYVLRYDILNSTGKPCQPLVTGGTTTGCAFDATGTVTITDNGAPLDQGTFPVNSMGHGEDQPIQLAPGTHAIVATYSGDNSYNKPASPTAVSLSVGKGATTTTLTVTDTTTVYPVGGNVPFKATVMTQSSGVAPDCTAIVLKDGNTVVYSGGDCVGNNGGAAGPAQVSFLGGLSAVTTGVHSFTASYPGDTYYSGSTSSPVSITFKLASNVIVAVNPAQVVQGQSTTLTAEVDPSNAPPTNPGPTGTVQFAGTIAGKIGNPVSCTPITSGAGYAACKASTTFTPASGDNIFATYSGDTNYAPNNFSGSVSLNVVQPSFTISGSNAAVTAGGSGSSTITITPTGFTGAVTVACQTLPGVTCSPLTINETSANTPATGALTINVAGPSSSTTAAVQSIDRIPMAQARPTSNWPWWPWSAGAVMATLFLLLAPRRQLRTASAVGIILVLSLTVSCGGGGGGGGGGTPRPTATITQLSVSSTKVAANGSITVSATVSGGTPTGNVQFFVDGVAVGAPVGVTNGSTGSISVSAANAPNFLPIVGTHTVGAHYLGTSTTSASQSATLNVTVTGTTILGITGTASTTAASAAISLTVN